MITIKGVPWDQMNFFRAKSCSVPKLSWAPQGLKIEWGIKTNKNKPGTAKVGAISKAQKQQKDFKVSKYSLLRYRKNPKVEPNWRTRGDTLRFFIHFVAIIKKNWRRGTFGENFFWEKVSQCRKNWKGGPFGIFQHPFCRKTPKKLKGDPLGKIFFSKKKSHSRKYSKGVTFGPFEFLRWC